MDHGKENENCALKVLGGIKGIKNPHQTLEEYFLTAAELGNMIDDLCGTFGIKDKKQEKLRS